MMVSYWTLPGSQRGGLTSPRSVRRCSVLMSDGLPRQFHALQDTHKASRGSPSSVELIVVYDDFLAPNLLSK